MARYGKEHKETSRRRIIEAAGERLKRDGIDGSGVSGLMADAGLTNGAFYNHFASKDDLVASVVAKQLADQVAVVNSLPAGLESVEAFLRDYLSPTHRDDFAGGCPSAALLDEIGRRDDTTKQAYTDGARSMIGAITRHLGGDAGRERTGDRHLHAPSRFASTGPGRHRRRPFRPHPRGGIHQCHDYCGRSSAFRRIDRPEVEMTAFVVTHHGPDWLNEAQSPRPVGRTTPSLT